jgi:hypothetical protein
VKNRSRKAKIQPLWRDERSAKKKTKSGKKK